jgi:hypothetical protein
MHQRQPNTFLEALHPKTGALPRLDIPFLFRIHILLLCERLCGELHGGPYNKVLSSGALPRPARSRVLEPLQPQPRQVTPGKYAIKCRFQPKRAREQL